MRQIDLNISGIYKIESRIHPERCYIGSAINIFDRWKQHSRGLLKNKHHSIKFQNHYNKHGKEDLGFSIVAICDERELIPVDKVIWIEQCFMWVYKPYFNASPTAGSKKGVKESMETRLKMGERRRGKKMNGKKGYRYTPEQSKRRSEQQIGKKNHRFGKKATKETIDKMSKTRTGMKKTQETKDKIGTSNIGKHYNQIVSQETRNKKSMAVLGDKNPMFGRHQGEESKLRLRES
jgi:group I intron endonuclease